MVTALFRKQQVLTASESTITNSGRISPPPQIPASPRSADETEEEEEGDLPQPLRSSSTTGAGAGAAPPSTVIRTVPPRATSNGTAISSLSVDSASDDVGRETAVVESFTLEGEVAGSTHSTTTTTTTTTPKTPPPRIFTDARDVSASSRDSLRRQVLLRKMSLTAQEQRYLGDLLVRGNEIEVQLAFEKLQDDELFFDHQTPKHHMGQPFYWEHGSMPGSTGSTEGERQASNSGAGSADIWPTLERANSQGSLRRLQALEQRRKSIQHLTLWRAHKSGLAVTHNGSRNSIMRRSNSIGSSSSSAVPRPPPSGGIFRPSAQRRLSSKGPKMPPKPAPAWLHNRSQSLIMPDVPPPARFQRRSSTNSSRKSVTFHQETDGTPKTKKLLRRSVSDTNALTSHVLTVPVPEECPPPLVQRQDSTSSIPSIHHAHPIRQDSVSSIPSLHHGHPIRQDSVSSIPSLHHGHPIRQDSVSSIPSLHHGHPIRQDSVSSIPSLHHGHPIRQDSVSSIPSLHHGHPLVREESFSSSHSQFYRSDSIPSLHHGHPLLDDASTAAASGIIPNPQYAASSDVANTWLQQSSQQSPTRERESSLGSLPHAVAIPSNDTDQTYPSTAGTATTTASTAHWEDDDEEQPQDSSTHSSGLAPASKPVLMRLASRNAYNGEGIEVTELHDQPLQDDYFYGSQSTFPGMISMDASIRTCNSWDTALSSYQPHPEIFRGAFPRSLSHEDMAPIFLGSGANLLLKDNSGRQISGYGENDEDDTSWDMNSENDRHDSWNVLKDEYVNGYGGGGSLDFLILGTDADDEAAQPHVLSPPLMESLQAFMPLAKSGQNFFLKYSMVRDGASLHTFLKRARGVQYSILALETIDGEVFGCFTGQPWRKNWNYFGSGESFLWRMRRSRLEKTHDILEQAHLESEIDVFPYTGENRFIQLCTHDRIALGGGTPAEKKLDDDSMMMPSSRNETSIQPHEWGFGLAISGDLLTGTSSPCVTFASPSLSSVHSKGSVFEIVNMELWTLTPCMTVEEAEKLELGKLFLERHAE